MSTDHPLGERRPIHIEDIEWQRYRDPLVSDERSGPLVRWLVDPASGNRVMQVRSAPNSWAPAHWHLSDTVYIVTRGELIVEGEPPYRRGDLRWVRGGFAYGPEQSGPEGCEYLFFSLGPYDKLDPDVAQPPLGRWDDPSTWIGGDPQLEREHRTPEKLEVAKRYLRAVAAADPEALSGLFLADGVIDDFVGGHHAGREGIEAFVRTWKPGQVGFSEPVDWLHEGDRLTLYGHVQRPGEPERDCVRWVFHFRGDRIAHLGNSKILAFPKR